MVMKSGTRSARQVPNLSEVPMSDSLRLLAAAGELQFCAKGRVVIQEGTAGNSIFIILSGSLRAFSMSDDGSREITYGEYLPGEFLGEMSLDDGYRSASVQAIAPTWCVRVTRATLELHIAKHPEFAFELISKVIRRARMATLSLRAIALNDVYGRIVWLLNERAKSQPDGSVAAKLMTHQQMADLLGCTRPMISRVLMQLKIGNYIEIGNHQIKVLKRLPTRF
jgi:CRP/FNR family cyclic AMP-dependent transcriptional regulator